MLKILELFGGIGAPRKALENIGFNKGSQNESRLRWINVLKLMRNEYADGKICNKGK